MPAPAFLVKKLSLSVGSHELVHAADEPVNGLNLPLRDTVLALLDHLVRHDGLGLPLAHQVAAT